MLHLSQLPDVLRKAAAVIADRLLARLRSLVGYVPTAWSLVRIAVLHAARAAGHLAGRALPARRADQPVEQGQGHRPLPRRQPAARGHPRLRAGRTARLLPHRLDRWFGDPRRPAAAPVDHPGAGQRPDRRGRRQARRPPTSTSRTRCGSPTSCPRCTAALASKPDLVVVSLNPVWVLNDLAVQQWGYLDGLLARGSVWPPSQLARCRVAGESRATSGWKGLSAPVRRRSTTATYWGAELTEKTVGPVLPRQGRGRRGAGADGARAARRCGDRSTSAPRMRDGVRAGIRACGDQAARRSSQRGVLEVDAST